MKFEVTLASLRKAGACIDGYNRVVYAIQGRPFEERETYLRFRHDAPIPLTAILESNGIDDALWALRCVSDVDRDARLFAVWCARQVEHLMTDQRSKDALMVAENFANGVAPKVELDAARAAAGAAAWAAWDAGDAGDAARAAAWAAAGAAGDAGDAAGAAAGAAAWAAGAAAGAAARAAGDAARAAAGAAQREMFIAMCEGRAPWQ